MQLFNPILDAVIAADAMGAPHQAGDPNAPALVPTVHITGRTADKFSMGWLGGVGGASQFQGVNCRLPVLPAAYNNVIEDRIAQSRGLKTGERLLTRWERPGNFNPGWGTDTWREGENVTWVLNNRGLQNVTTGSVGPMSYPAQDRTATDAINPFIATSQGLAAVTTAPVTMVSSITGYHAGMSVDEMQRVANRMHTQQRVARGLVARHGQTS